MAGEITHIHTETNQEYYLVLDTRDCFTCSFTEFLPFNSAMYYYSSFKAFNTLTPSY